ncbi:hypothetical protein [Nostoc sp.]|uniref:hypothetical protein n=1 Tax=Nostoc sp. TaxID=1180 RepID=UPI002FFCBA3B
MACLIAICCKILRRDRKAKEIRDAKNSTPQTVPLGNGRALIKIKQPQNCCWLVTIQKIVVQIVPE